MCYKSYEVINSGNLEKHAENTRKECSIKQYTGLCPRTPHNP